MQATPELHPDPNQITETTQARLPKKLNRAVVFATMLLLIPSRFS